MNIRFPRLHRLAEKIGGHARLLREDPERFARNVLQFTNPALFEQRLVDTLGTTPMHVRYDAGAPPAPRLNVLDNAWTKTGMTGGPNTIINLVCRVAQHGVAVRLVSTSTPVAVAPAWFRTHAESLVGRKDFPNVDVVSASSQAAPLELGPGDVFLVSHWSTAQQLKAVLPMLPVQQFFYMLQEFEPGFYPWSSNFALALETYGMDFWPVINEATLADFLFLQPYGRLADPVTRQRALVFEPAVDSALFFPAPQHDPARKRCLLFYARPSNARNMFGLGLLALREAAANPAFAGWEFLAIGGRGSVPELALGSGHVLRAAPWTTYAGYGDLLRSADILLCPMLSPHTSYPVLEMAACGGLSVTNTFATKTQAVLAAISPSIIAVEPTAHALAAALVQGAERIAVGTPLDARISMRGNWGDVLGPLAGRMAEVIRELVTR